MSNVKNFTKTIFIVVAFINVIYMLLTLSVEPGSKASFLASIIIFLLVAPIIIFYFWGKLETLAWNTALVSVIILVFEVSFYFKLIEHPAISTWKTFDSEQQQIKVDFLDTSPFVKLKPNITVWVVGNRGADFTYSWKTDRLGFKNVPSKEEVLEFDFIALGDSFTEGMGVSTNDTWTHQITQNNVFSVYNAGVQGYAASQMYGTYQLIEDEILHNSVIIGAYTGTYRREAKFFEKKISEMQKGVGGIGHIARGSPDKKNSFLVSFLRATYYFAIIESGYKKEIPTRIDTQQSLSASPDWLRYVDAFRSISERVHANNKRVILVQFPSRYAVYFSANEQGLSDISESQYYVEINSLKKSLPSNVEILDMLPFLKENFDKNGKYLYFEQDGHMNEHGNALVARFLNNYFNRCRTTCN